MSALFLWILGVLGVLFVLFGLTRLSRGGLAWMGFGLLVGLFGLGGAWLHQQYGHLVFWVLGVLGVLLLVWALLNLRSRLAGWAAALAVLLGLAGFGSVVLLNSGSPNLLASGTIPNPSEEPQAAPPAVPTPEPTAPAFPSPEPVPPAPEAPTSGAVREVEPVCPCLLSVRVNAPNPTVRVFRGEEEVASSRLERSSFLLEAGEYTLRVEAPGYQSLSAPIRIPENKNLEVELVQ
ncbi:MAG: hypothetical protein NZ849_00425 [Meiothermus sp.]|uniref:PEGA domain-containing protein n=1 Tax=Meiothermus sp. TaxID=1955249 RepID=UPI0025F9E779|nr:PEGA domain-containing protein [Meiothermus sp.]MCS7057710.1 hypothetical protein [Meiothermus sp.]MCS7193377.1 hypothetical protein [Meiothermus sp.]MCX7739869.1 hypothetical protein [Meiothermus sp.]MDW8090890.1 hypothetical protein [Meiothermus sp.]MDW8482028.1 hypothetical protein [Meiothermus sp.]